MKEYGLDVNGEWVKSSPGRTFLNRNPAGGEPPALLARGSRQDVDKAPASALRDLPARKDLPEGPWRVDGNR